MTGHVPRTIIVALDMTRSSLDASLAGGAVPHLAALATAGVRASIAPSRATPALWPTIMSGVLPCDHGIVIAEERWAGGFRPAGRASWRAAPFWERLEAGGVPTIGVGWPCSAPGAAWSGAQVDDRLAEPSGADWDGWYLPRDVAPGPLRDLLRDVRVHPADIAGASLRPFVPELAVVDQVRDRRLIDVALALARFSTEYAALSALMRERAWALAGYRCDLLARLAGFEEAAAPFDRVVRSAWALLDGAVGELVSAAGAGGTTILVSPGRDGEAGMLLASGPGLPAGVELPAMGVLDIVPSLLARFGLADPALPGTARLNAPPTLRPAPAPAMPVPDPPADPADLDRAARFGFAPPSPDPRVAARHLLGLAEARLLEDPAGAAAHAERALAIVPGMPEALGLLAAARAVAGEFDALPAIADRLEACSPGHRWLPLIRGGFHAARREAASAAPLLRVAEAVGGPAEWMRIAAAWLMLRRPGEARRLFSAVLARMPDAIDALVGLGLTSGTDWIAGERAYRRALLLDPANARAGDGLDRILRRTARRVGSGAG